MNLTREQAIAWHRKMWSWIADMIEKEKRKMDITRLKEQYCDAKGFKNIFSGCFLCEYTGVNCKICPLDWGNHSRIYMCERNNGLWIKCRDSEDWQEQAALARQIANLPEMIYV